MDTGISQIIVGVVASSKEVTRHQKRFGISSFIYRARRPFHPGRLYDVFLEPHFFFHGSMKEEAEEIEKLGLETRQRNAAAKHSKRWQHNCAKNYQYSPENAPTNQGLLLVVESAFKL